MNTRIRKFSINLMLAALLIGSMLNQWNYNISYYFRNGKDILSMLSRTEEERDRVTIGSIMKIVDEINTLPESSILYFIPVFPDSPGAKENQTWWWMMNIALRYFCYPRKIVSINFRLYHDNKAEYIQMYMKEGKTYADQEWVKLKKITHLILYRNNSVSILPITASIKLE